MSASRRPAVLALLLALPTGAVAQEEARNVVYAEAGGSALVVGSVNYERMVTSRVSLRVGASPFGVFPVLANYLHGSGDHRAEFGLGVLLGDNEGAFATAAIGYRFQPRTRGLVVRTTLVPVVASGESARWFGVSFGATF